mgnify:FL=1
MAFNTPIAFIVFNRPRHTRKTFESIRRQKPTQLFIISDGPRSGHPTDEANCKEVREIVSAIDWPCNVHHNFSDRNLGCKQRVISGLDWVFEQVDRAIIIEDDCLPNDDFYRFCETLLEHHQHDEQVMTITGNNFQEGNVRGDASYYFSKYNHIWGWATWRRAWKKNDASLPFWPTWKISQDWENHSPYKAERDYWTNIFEQMYKNEIDTWDYPWTACIWYHHGLIATPQVNLVTNIGFGPDGTHTRSKKDQEGLPTYTLGPITYPKTIEQNVEADRYVFDHLLGGLDKQWHWFLLRLPKRVIKKIYRMFQEML